MRSSIFNFMICVFLFMNCGEKESNTQPSSSTNNGLDPVTKERPAGSLSAYLQNAVVNQEVEALANIGVKTYQDKSSPLAKARAAAAAAGQMGGGRTDTWIKDTFKKDEDVIVDELKKIDAPQTFSLKEVQREFDEAIKKHRPEASAKKAKFVLVKKLGINYLHESKIADNESFIQLASQFNFLESPSAHVVNVSDYLGDKTQGPQGSIEAAAAALHRSAAVLEKKLSHALVAVLPTEHSKYYKDGYLELSTLSADEQKSVHDYIVSHLDELRILPQWVIQETTGRKNLQIFSAAPSFQGAGMPTPDSYAGKISSLLVANQYEAIAKLAIIRHISTRKPVNVHYTLVGQGVFNNPPEVMTEAFRRVANVAKGYPDVHIYVHGYDVKAQTLIRAHVDKTLVDLEEMDG